MGGHGCALEVLLSVLEESNIIMWRNGHEFSILIQSEILSCVIIQNQG